MYQFFSFEKEMFSKEERNKKKKEEKEEGRGVSGVDDDDLS